MSISFKISVLAGALALAAGGSAMANTSIDGTTTGDLFLNIVDNTNNTSFIYDTGVAQSTFNGATGSYSYALASDPNYQSFITGQGSGDSIDYSVISATKASPTATLYFTSNQVVSAVAGSAISQAQGGVVGFLGSPATSGANSVASTTTISALLPANITWGAPSNEGFVGNQLQIGVTGDSAALGTALSFYGETSSSLRSATTFATVSTFAGQWDLANGVLSYSVAGGGGTAVPLPTPLLLLLSGLGLMGVVARRGKSSEAVAV